MKRRVSLALILTGILLCCFACVPKSEQIKGTWEFSAYKNGAVQSIIPTDCTICFESDGTGFFYLNSKVSDRSYFVYSFLEDGSVRISVNGIESVVNYSIGLKSKQLTFDGLVYKRIQSPMPIEKQVGDNTESYIVQADPSPITTPLPTQSPTPTSTPWAEGDWTWSFEKGVLRISGTGNMRNFEWNESPWYDQRNAVAKVIVEEGITGIGDWAFAYCENVSSVHLPNTLEYIGSNAFFDCHNKLASIDIPQGVVYIGRDAFCRCWSIENISIPSSVKTIVENPFACCTKVKRLTVDDNNPYFKVVDGILFSKDMKTLICYLPTNSIANYTIPHGVTTIGNDAFFECRNLKSIVIPEGVTDIGFCAFIYCYNLERISIPLSVNYIGSSAFASCDNLSIYYAGSVDQWGMICSNMGTGERDKLTVYYSE